jgi:hypothetical protein
MIGGWIAADQYKQIRLVEVFGLDGRRTGTDGRR